MDRDHWKEKATKLSQEQEQPKAIKSELSMLVHAPGMVEATGQGQDLLKSIDRRLAAIEAVLPSPLMVEGDQPWNN